jgi:hypothetical protein
MSTAGKTFERKGKERIKTLRKNVSTTAGNHTISVDHEFIIFRNGGTSDIRINFKTEDLDTTYMTLKPDDQLPPIGIYNGLKINFKSIGGSSKLECILWA